ncbi:MAG: DUF1707 SHOCT-like domain-containing protein [Gemmatimonadota bacterium]
MDEPRSDLPVAVNREKEHAIARLRAHYVRDDIDVEEYERLIDVAWAADSRADLEAIFSRLPELPEADRPPAPETGDELRHAPALARRGEQKNTGFQIALLGGSDRKGAWVPPKKLHTLALMGGAGLDFREAHFGPGVTEVNVLAVMGGVEVIVPPGVTVESAGFGIMGGFDGHSQTVASDDPDAPVLRIRGLAVMGGIDVKMMLPGETPRDARRRVKEDRRRRRIERKNG